MLTLPCQGQICLFPQNGEMNFRHPESRHDRGMSQSGFTLIELLVVVAVIAVLAMILTPSYKGAIASANLREGQMHAQSVRMALNTALANNPQLMTATLGTVDCTAARDVGASGVSASAGGNGWDAAPTGSTCSATPLTSRTYQVRVTLSDGTVVVAP